MSITSTNPADLTQAIPAVHDRRSRFGARPAARGWRPTRWSAREWVRFVRQRNRLVGAIGQPIIFWLLFGAGLGQSFRLPGSEGAGISYREYFFPGTVVMILLFTAIFSTISIIEDRREGFLQSVLVAPVPRMVDRAGQGARRDYPRLRPGAALPARCARWSG